MLVPWGFRCETGEKTGGGGGSERDAGEKERCGVGGVRRKGGWEKGRARVARETKKMYELFPPWDNGGK